MEKEKFETAANYYGLLAANNLQVKIATDVMTNIKKGFHYNGFLRLEGVDSDNNCFTLQIGEEDVPTVLDAILKIRAAKEKDFVQKVNDL